MEKSSPSKLSKLKEQIELLTLVVEVNQSVAAVLEEYSYRLYALEEDNKRLLANYRALDQHYNDLRTKYPELQYLSKSRSKV